MTDTFVVKYAEFNQLLTDQAPEHVKRISKTVVGVSYKRVQYS